MAETLLSNISRHIGTAADRAAMSTTGLLLGSEFMETDTGLRQIWDGSSWVSFGVQIADPADTTRKAEFDNKFTIPVGIDVAHHEIHEGDSYVVEHVESGAGFSLCFKVPSGTKRNHIVFIWAAESKAELSLFEGREWDASSGSLVTIYNRDRNSANASQLQENQSTGSFIANSAVILNPTNIGAGGNAAGTEIRHWEIWSDKKQTTVTREISEWILKNDQVYVVTFLSNDGAKGAHVILDFYEHTDE